MIVLHQRTFPIPRLTLPCHNKSSLHHMPHSPPLGGCLMEDAPLIQPGKQLWKPSSYNVTCKSWACRAACLAGTDSLTPGGPDGSSKPSETWAKVTFPTTIWLSWPKFPSSWCPSLENTTIIHNLWHLLNGKTTPKSLALGTFSNERNEPQLGAGLHQLGSHEIQIFEAIVVADGHVQKQFATSHGQLLKVAAEQFHGDATNLEVQSAPRSAGFGGPVKCPTGQWWSNHETSPSQVEFKNSGHDNG